jgi:ribosomal protein L7/L12
MSSITPSTIVYAVIFAAVAIVVLYGWVQDAAARRSGILPAPGKSTIADVERLAKMGKVIWAIKCYREIYSCGLEEAKRAVEKLRPPA